MKEIPEKYADLLRDFVDLLKETFKDNVISVVLYGSVARGNARKDSDIDICLIFKSLPRSRYKRTLLISPLLQSLRERDSYQSLYNEGYLSEITPILYTTEEMQDTKFIFLYPKSHKIGKILIETFKNDIDNNFLQSKYM